MTSYMGEYNENIFINCPDDEDYESMFKAIMFAVTANEFIPVCAKSKKGGDIRVSKICELITKCKYGIHDISKTEPDKDNNLPRFNMPFELGLFFGCQKYGNDKDKDFIVFDRTEHRYEKFLSDIKGLDVEAHNDEPLDALRGVNSWLSVIRMGAGKPRINPKRILDDYEEYVEDFSDTAKIIEIDINNLEPIDYHIIAGHWIEKQKKQLEEKSLEIVKT